MAEVQRQRDGSFLLIENHCPISAAANVRPKLCEAEMEVFLAIHLVQQGRDAGGEEKRIKEGHERSDSVGFVARARMPSFSRFRFLFIFFSSRIQVRGTFFYRRQISSSRSP